MPDIFRDKTPLPELTPSRLIIPPCKYQNFLALITFVVSPHPATGNHRISCFKLDQGTGVQIRAWGYNLKDAFEQSGMAVLDYMTNLSNITIKGVYAIHCFGEDIVTLLESFLYELTRIYITKPFWLTRKVEIVQFLDLEFNLCCYCYGEYYKDHGNYHNDVPKVKNPRFSYMQVCNEPENHRFETFVTIDPSHPRDRF